MVFLFIAYLSIIFLICFPFEIKIVVFCANYQKKFGFYAKIGFLMFSNDKNKKQKMNIMKKIRFFKKIKLKKISVNKLIDYKIALFATRPKPVSDLEKAAFGAPLVSISKKLDALMKKMTLCVVDNDDKKLFFQFNLAIKTNLSLIFSLILQTITFGRLK